MESSFLWLKYAGVAIATINATEPRISLNQNAKSSLLKLYSSDVGLLTYQYGNTLRSNILFGNDKVNLGGIYENFVAQQLNAHGYPSYFYNNHSLGELDFVIEHGGSVVPIEVKSGKDYYVHSAISKATYNEEYNGSLCLVARQGIEGYDKHDCWGTVYIFFNYDSKGNVNILNIQFEKYDFRSEYEEYDSFCEDEIIYSEYTDELIFNFGGRFFLSDSYTEPKHGEGTPLGWYALGGEGKCIDPSCSTRETFTDGKLTEYRWLDNHSDCTNILTFSVGDYSCCLYKYSFDLFTAPELEQYPDVDPTSEYWVVFYTEGEGKTLYVKYYNCDFFTQEQAMESICPGLALVEY